MSEIEMVMEALIRTRTSGRKAALATVVGVKGSAYRREGAKMLIDEDENRIGMISGGCLENDVAEVAKMVIASGIPILRAYDLDEDLVWGLGLGCPGKVEIYIEPITVDYEMESSPIEGWVKSFEERKESILATVLQPELGKLGRLFMSREGSFGDLGNEELNVLVKELACKKLDETNPKAEAISVFLSGGEQVKIFLDIYLPPFELMVFGAGHDAIPVVNFAEKLGFQTTVVDQREVYNSKDRFPNAKRFILKPSQFQEKLEVGNRTYVVVMNHHLERDQETIKFVLDSPTPYVGVLGPSSRMMRMMEALENEGSFFNEKELEKMHNPIGLDIGAVSSEEIAISILAEVIAMKNGHHGGFLKGSEYIHHKNARTELKLV